MATYTITITQLLVLTLGTISNGVSSMCANILIILCHLDPTISL